MRQTPLPLLRDLPPGKLVARCFFCNRMAIDGERCQGTQEAEACPPRSVIERVVDPTTIKARFAGTPPFLVWRA